MPAASVRASVVFLKMEDFAHRPVTEQTRLRAQLEAVAAVITADLDPADRIMLDAQDGVAIVVLRDPESALRLAELALSAGAAGLPLSVGINFGSIQLAGDGMVGDGIAVAASVADFASSRLLVSRSFRDAIAGVAPGLEAALVRAGTFTDGGLRTHELFRLEWGALRRRERRYRALSAAAAIVILGAGIGVRIAEEGRQRFVDGVVAKYHSTAAQGERYLRGLVDRVRFLR